jgi:hypothetical protein
MRPDTVVVGSIGLEDLAQVGLIKYQDVIQALPTDRANQSLRMVCVPKIRFGVDAWNGPRKIAT